MSLPLVNPKFDAWTLTLEPAQLAELEAAWTEILTHEDIGGRNGDYARRYRLLCAAARLFGYEAL